MTLFRRLSAFTVCAVLALTALSASPASAASPTTAQRFSHNVRGGTHYTFTNEFDFYNGGSVVFTKLEAHVWFYLTNCRGGRVSPVLYAKQTNVAYNVKSAYRADLSCVRITAKANASHFRDPRIIGGVTDGATDAGPYLYNHTSSTNRDAVDVALSVAILNHWWPGHSLTTGIYDWHGISAQTRKDMAALRRCVHYADWVVLIADAASTGYAFGQPRPDPIDIALNGYEFVAGHTNLLYQVDPGQPVFVGICDDLADGVSGDLAFDGYTD